MSYENLLKGVARNTSDDFRGNAELCISGKTIKVVQKSTRNILSEHPIRLISFFQPIKEPQYFCFVGKGQIHGSIENDRACFFFKLDSQEDMTVLKDSFQNYFQRAADSASIQSSGSSSIPSASSIPSVTSASTSKSSTLGRLSGGNKAKTPVQRTASDFGEYLSGKPTFSPDIRSSLASLDVGGSVRLADDGDFAHHNTLDTGVYSGTDSGLSQ